MNDNVTAIDRTEAPRQDALPMDFGAPIETRKMKFRSNPIQLSDEQVQQLHQGGHAYGKRVYGTFSGLVLGESTDTPKSGEVTQVIVVEADELEVSQIES